MKLKDLPKIERPREKLEKYGPERLSDVELLALFIGSGIKGKGVMELSRDILKQIQKIGATNIKRENLEKISGLGKAKISQILAMIEFGQRLNKNQGVIVNSPDDVWKLCVDVHDSKKEHFIVFYLNTCNQLIKRKIISIGTLNANLVHPREVFEPALKCSAAQIIVAHNHPSGNTKPSEDDQEITNRLVEAGKMMGIEIMDHIIVAKNSKFSFKEEKLL